MSNYNNQYNINPVNRGVNNFFEGLTNSTNPRYIQPIQQFTPQQPQPTYVPPRPINTAPYVPFVSKIYKQPTTMYTPERLRSHFEPLNPSYNYAFNNK